MTADLAALMGAAADALLRELDDEQ